MNQKTARLDRDQLPERLPQQPASPRYWLRRGLLAMLLVNGCAQLGLAAETPATPTVPASTGESDQAATLHPSLEPIWQAVVVPPTTTEDKQKDSPQFRIQLMAGTEELHVTGIVVDCACVRPLNQLPFTVAGGAKVPLQFAISVLLPGAKEIRVHTSAGILRARIDLSASDQLRSGRNILETAWQKMPAGASLLVVAHDLRAGDPTACNCSPVGLGGVKRLRHFTDWIAQHQATHELAAPTLLLSGSVSESPGGVAAILLSSGWRRAQRSEIVVSERPLVRLRNDDKALVVPSTTSGPLPAHGRLLIPLLRDGTGVSAVIRRADGIIIEQITIPIDDSFATLPTNGEDPGDKPDGP